MFAGVIAQHGQRISARAAVAAVLLLSFAVSASFAPVLASDKSSTTAETELEGRVSISRTCDRVTQRVDELIDIAVRNDPELQELDRKNAHYAKFCAKLKKSAMDALNYTILDRGTSPSAQAGDILLDEKVVAKNLYSSQLLRQKKYDAAWSKIVPSIMQIAMGLGLSKSDGEKLISSGVDALSQVVGAEEAAKTRDIMTSWSQQLKVPEQVFKQPVWDVQQSQKNLGSILQASIDTDPVIKEVKKLVYRYNHRSKLYQNTNRIVLSTLGLASMTPTLVGPAAQIAQLLYIMAAGGPEEDKLMSEFYLDKRLDSRWKVINESAHLALDKYQIGVLTHNPVLLACSQSVVRRLVSDDALIQVFGSDNIVAPIVPPAKDLAFSPSVSTAMPQPAQSAPAPRRRLPGRRLKQPDTTTDMDGNFDTFVMPPAEVPAL